MRYAMQGPAGHVVRMRLRGKLSDVDWEQLYFDFDELLLLREPFATVVDTRGLSVPELGRVQELAQFLRLRSEPIRRLHLGVACVLDSVLLRGVLEAMRRLDALAMAVEVVASPDLGLRWVSARVADRFGQSSAEVYARIGGWRLDELESLPNAS